jgi:hypothetical protein
VEVPDSARLPVEVDAAALARDVDSLPEEAWVPHFNTGIYVGDWSGVPLHMVGGRSDRLFPDPDAAPGTPATATPWLPRCPAVGDLLDRLPCAVTSARLLRLGQGASVGEHRDDRLGYADGEARLHVPVSTDPGAEFLLNGRRIPMAPGECWYVDVRAPHAVANHGTAPRVHLVIDCVVDEWLDRVMSRAVGQG